MSVPAWVRAARIGRDTGPALFSNRRAMFSPPFGGGTPERGSRFVLTAGVFDGRARAAQSGWYRSRNARLLIFPTLVFSIASTISSRSGTA